MLNEKKRSTFINWVCGFQFVCTLVVLSTGEPKPQYPGGGTYQYGSLSGGYQGPQQAVLYSINNDHYLLRLLQDMEKYEGNEVNYLVNSKIKNANYGMYPYSTSSTSTTTTTATPDPETTSEGDSSIPPSSTSTSAPPSSSTTPKSNCEIVIGKNGYVSSKVAYYQYPTGNYKPAVGYPMQPPVIYKGL